MKVSELMIGDWVQYPYGIRKVTELDGFLDRVCSEDFSVGEVDAIPLTPEILEKNGFSDKYAEDGLSYATDYSGDVIAVHICGNGGIMDEMYFKYVHELQHAMRLCGIEKEIIV